MKKLMMMLVVLGLLLALPATAGARKPPEPPGPDPKLEGFTCAEYAFDDPSLWYRGTASDDFSLTLDSVNPYACFDVISKAGEWNFKFEATGSVAGFQMHVKNSQPGDKCWAEDWKLNRKHPIIPSSWTSPWTQAASELACGDRVATDEDASLVFIPSYLGAEDSSLTITVTLPEPEIH